MIYAGHWGKNAADFLAENQGPGNDVTGCGPYLGFVTCFSGDYQNTLGTAHAIPGFPNWDNRPLRPKAAIAGLNTAISAARKFAKKLCENRKKFCDDGTKEAYHCGSRDQRCDSVTITVTCDADMNTLTTTGTFQGNPVELSPGHPLKPSDATKQLCAFSETKGCLD
jgi:hypothetical protein